MKSAGFPANFEVRCAGCNIYHPIETVKVHDNSYYCWQCYLLLWQGAPIARKIECKDCGTIIVRDRLVEDDRGKFCCPKCGNDLGVRQMRPEIPAKEDLARTARMFRRLGDPCRVKIIESLSEGELNVSAFVEITGAQYSLTSYHLKVLKELDLIRSCKKGNFVNYSLTDKGRAAHEFIKKYNLPGQG